MGVGCNAWCRRAMYLQTCASPRTAGRDCARSATPLAMRLGVKRALSRLDGSAADLTASESCSSCRCAVICHCTLGDDALVHQHVLSANSWVSAPLSGTAWSTALTSVDAYEAVSASRQCEDTGGSAETNVKSRRWIESTAATKPAKHASWMRHDGSECR